jgi:hypothetical protein
MASKGVVQFKEDKKTGQIYFYVQGSKWGWQKFGSSSHGAADKKLDSDGGYYDVIFIRAETKSLAAV